MKIVISDVDIIKEDLSVINIIESHQEVHERGFSTSWFSHQGYLFIRVDNDAQSLKDKILLSRWVSKPDISELNFSFDVFNVQNFLFILKFFLLINSNCADGGWIINNLKDSLGSSSSFTHIWAKSTRWSKLLRTKHDTKESNEDIFWISSKIAYNLSTSIEHWSKNEVLSKLWWPKSQSSFNMRCHSILINWCHEIFIHLDYYLVVSKWLDCLVVCHGITSKKVCFFG